MTRHHFARHLAAAPSRTTSLVVMAVWLAACSLPAVEVDKSKLPPAATRPVDFARDIRPIFTQHCLSCHGPEKQKSGYRVDVKAVALKGGDTHGTALVPGRSAESPLIRFVAGLAEDMLMPPKGERLTAGQIGLLRAWIDQGANWPETAGTKQADPLNWWSLRPLTKPAVPRIQDARFRIQNPVDAFVVAKLQEKKLAQSPEADARTLVRRLYFDLVGLPPTPERVERFVKDADPKSYDKLVDELLASPHYGERWARHWLDVVHYGDTHGYDKDKLRPNAWPYRDYVIRAFNEDKPYARFVQEQIAGDALFPGTREGVEALGFIAAGPWDFIGHAEVPESKIDGKIARHLDRDDMVQNTIGTFNSLTIGCAQCHNHKFDPIPQADYYSLQSIFAALDRADKKYFADAKLTQRFAELEHRQRTFIDRKNAVEARLKQAAGKELEELDRQIEAANKMKGGLRPEYGYHSGIAPAQDTAKWVQVDLGRSVVIDRVVLRPCYDDFNKIGAGFGFPVRFKVEASDDAQFKAGVVAVADKTAADFATPGTAPQTFKSTGATARFIRVTATKLATRQNDFILALAELQAFDSTGSNVALKAAVTALDSIEAPPRWRKTNLTDDIAPAADNAGELAGFRAKRDALIAKATDDKTRAELASLAKGLEQVAVDLKQFPKPDVIYAGTVHYGSGSFAGTGATGGKPRVIKVLHRGDVRQPKADAAPGAPSYLTGLPAEFALPPDAAESERRAALAKWLSSPDNPLTWRSIVNRVWQYHFGRGLVETPNDFGRMGALPTHPELLNWLALEFRDGGGSLKKLHKLIAMSATYRQASTNLPLNERLDGDNSLLWRQNRRKLDAESVRDSALFISGKLDARLGGPAFQDFVITHPEHSPHYEYHLHDPDDPRSHRRSIYRFIVRSQMQPFMTALDCADPSMQVGRRNESVSPLQSLALLNNSFMLAMSKHFAAKLDGAGGDLPTKMERAFREALARTPSPKETEILVAYARQHGLANACRVIFNLNEFVFVD